MYIHSQQVTNYVYKSEKENQCQDGRSSLPMAKTNTRKIREACMNDGYNEDRSTQRETSFRSNYHELDASVTKIFRLF